MCATAKNQSVGEIRVEIRDAPSFDSESVPFKPRQRAGLESAYLRCEHARRRLDELRAIHDALCAEAKSCLVIKGPTEQVIPPGGWSEVVYIDDGMPLPDIPDECPLLLGEVANSLRSSLDYLVGQLAMLDSGSKPKQLQFPIERDQRQFKGQIPKRLAGLSDVHIARIEALQPYSNGPRWTEWLRRINNVDKHDDLLVLDHKRWLVLDKKLIPTGNDEPALQVNASFEPFVAIELDTGMPLIEVLEEALAGVVSVLDSFKPDFPRVI